MFFIGFGLASSFGYVFSTYIDPFFFAAGRLEGEKDLKSKKAFFFFLF